MNFDNLFIYDLANNHQGDVDHAWAIVDEIYKHIIDHGQHAIKLQYRTLPNIIHASDRKSAYAERFLSTSLEADEFGAICDYIYEQAMLLCITPFDEPSVMQAMEHGVDILKVASCSATDWPLLEVIAETTKPVVISTGGLAEASVDKIVSFCEHRGMEFALHHCVSLYPTRSEHMQLGTIQAFKRRYPGITIGWSTHEDPARTDVIQMAYALGARMFERHVGVATDKHKKLNAYSATPEQIRSWLMAWQEAVLSIGSLSDYKHPPSMEEMGKLRGLRRGIYANRDIMDGEVLNLENTEFCLPLKPSQHPADDYDKLGLAVKDIAKGEPVCWDSVEYHTPLMDTMGGHIHQMKAMLNLSGVMRQLPPDFEVEYSHHYGIERFLEAGVTMIDIMNRHYAKKILIMLAGQAHPAHFHTVKDETFLVLWGDLEVDLNGQRYRLKEGDQLTVQAGNWHSFSSVYGCIFEEISTTAIAGDSEYRDPAINQNKHRKTRVQGWGRFQLKEKIDG